MAGAALRIRIELEDGRASRAVKRLLQATTDTTPVFREIGEYLDLATRERFDKEKAPDGVAWAPLSEKYRKEKERRGKGHAGTLVFSGALRDTLRYRARDDSLAFGTDRVYGAMHQFGGDGVGIPIPERPYLGLSQEDTTQIVAILDRAIHEAASAA